MKPSRRKLLVATVGVAAITYVGCQTTTSGNLMAPLSDAETDAFISSGNLMAPVDSGSGSDARTDADAGTPDAGDAQGPTDASSD